MYNAGACDALLGLACRHLSICFLSPSASERETQTLFRHSSFASFLSPSASERETQTLFRHSSFASISFHFISSFLSISDACLVFQLSPHCSFFPSCCCCCCSCCFCCLFFSCLIFFLYSFLLGCFLFYLSFVYVLTFFFFLTTTSFSIIAFFSSAAIGSLLHPHREKKGILI